MNTMAASSKGYSNTSTDSYLDQENHHLQCALFAPQLELQNNDNDNNQMSFTMMNHLIPSSSTHPTTNNMINCDFMRKYGGGPYDFANFDQAFLPLTNVPVTFVDPSASSVIQDHQRQGLVTEGMKPPTLNIFPSQPVHVGHRSSTSTTKVFNSIIVSPSNNGSKRPLEPSKEDIVSNPHVGAPSPPLSQFSKAIKRERNKKGAGSTSPQDHLTTPDPKTLRRLAQNREAARNSRMRKKAYVEHLEASRVRLAQIEHQLEIARTQGVFVGGGTVLAADQGLPRGIGYISSDAAAFDMEYLRWLEEHRSRIGRLQFAVDENLPEYELRMCVESCITHFDELMHIKSVIVKADVFHIVSGMWRTPAERCTLWIGGFRPSDIIKIIPGQIEALTEQQIMGIFGLRNQMQGAEEQLSQELEKLNKILSLTIVSDSLKSPKHTANYMGQMVAAVNNLKKLEDIVIQADNLRLQTIYRVHQLLTTHQASRSLLAISEYYNRLRSLGTLWAHRNRQA